MCEQYQQRDPHRRDRRHLRPAVAPPQVEPERREQDVFPDELLEEIERERHPPRRLEHRQQRIAGPGLHRPVHQREMPQPHRQPRELAGHPARPRHEGEVDGLGNSQRACGDPEAIGCQHQHQVEALATLPLDHAPFPQRDADQHRAERLDHVPYQPRIGQERPIAPRLARIGDEAALMCLDLPRDASVELGIGLVRRDQPVPVGQRLAVRRGRCLAGALVRVRDFDLVHQLGTVGILAQAVLGNADRAQHRPAQPERQQHARRQRSERKEEQSRQCVDVEDVPGPEQDEHVEQPEGEQPQVSPPVEIGDRDRSVGRHRLARQHHHAGAEEEFEQAALRARQEHVDQRPGILVRRAPAERADIRRELPDRGGHIGHVDVEDAQDREPAQDIEHVDACLAPDGRQYGIARLDHVRGPPSGKTRLPKPGSVNSG